MLETVSEQAAVPEVSVIIPAYCAAKYIKTALDSVRAQTVTNFEVIVVNDGSPDTGDLELILDRSGLTITYIKQENKGPAAARNAAIRVAAGTYLAFLDSDDYWMPNYLSDQLAIFRSGLPVDLVYADAVLVENPLLSGKTFMSLTPSNGQANFEGLLTARCTIILSGTVVRKQCVVDAGLFDEALSHSEDFDLWLRLARAGAKLVYQKKALLFRRELPTSLCGNPISLLRCQIRVYIKLLRQNRLAPHEEALVRKQIAKTKAAIKLEQARLCFARGEFRRAQRSIEAASLVTRSLKLRVVTFWLRHSPGLLFRIYKYRERRLQLSKPASASVS